MLSIDVVERSAGDLAESPLWDAATGQLFWVDITSGSLHRRDAHGVRTKWDLHGQVGCVVLRRGGGAVVALDRGLYKLNLESGELTFLADTTRGPLVRYNDGKCDRDGRLWIGTFDDTGETRAALYRLEAGRPLECVRSGASGSNGIDWSPDGRILYWVDSLLNTIFAFDFNLETGAIRSARPLVTKGRGVPDGITVDSDGCLWCAWWDGWCVTRHRPDGSLIQTLEMPVARPTSVVFGGPHLDELYVTSAAGGLSPESDRAGALAGALFVHRPGVSGLECGRFAG
jgi:sugar lactone lactonase YvrE